MKEPWQEITTTNLFICVNPLHLGLNFSLPFRPRHL